MRRLQRSIRDSRRMSVVARFRREADGIAIVYFLIAMPVFIGLSLLAIDTSRGNNLHYDVQKAVDALALAAAAELDGGPTSIIRAREAMRGMLRNSPRFNDEGSDVFFRLPQDGEDCPVDVPCVRVDFLNDLPPSDDTPIDDRPYPVGNVVSDDEWDVASFAWVRARNVGGDDFRQRMTTLFPINYLAGQGSATLRFGAEAVAGGTGGASGEFCGLAPVFICNPFEGLAEGEAVDNNLASLHDLADPDNPNFGRLLEFRQQPGEGKGGGKGGEQANHVGGPGNWSFLGCVGTDDCIDKLASSEGFCTENGQSTTQPGFAVPNARGLNVRFDRYEGQASDNTNSDYAPSTNVRDGYIPTGADGCEYVLGDPEEVMGLEGDRNLEETDLDVIEYEGATFGKGDWDFQKYWDINFGHDKAKGVDENGVGLGNYNEILDVEGWSSENPPTRYEMYRAEIKHNMVNAQSVGGETGDPACYAGDPPPSDDPDRRMIKVAIVNCGEEIVRGRSSLSVAFYAELFLTTPIGHNDPTDRNIRGEIVKVSGIDGTGDFGVEAGVRPEVILYR